MLEIVRPLIISSILFLSILMIVLIINCITYFEIYKKATEQKNRIWGISMFIVSVFAIFFSIVGIIALSFTLMYYGPNKDYDEYIKSTTKIEIDKKNNSF